MKYVTLFALLFVSFNLFGQNIAPNSDFEDFINCPTDISQFPVVDWLVPTTGTSDYFHSCGGPNASVPTNLIGFQNSNTGNAYAGLVTYQDQVYYREYIQAQLTSPTIAGACYQLTIVYSPADNAGFANGLGMYLSAGVPATYDGVPAQLVKTTIQESNDVWHTLTAQYISPGGETHVTIGSFINDAATNHVPNGSFNTLAYYYVDSIAVEYTGEPSTNINVDLGPDLDVCEADFPITITSNLPNAFNIWSTGETGTSIQVDGPGIYSVQSFVSCEFATDLIIISVIPEPSIVVEDQTICEGEDYTIIADPTVGTYEWDDGSTSNEYVVTEEGTYSVTLTYACGDIVDDFEVNVLLPIEIPEPMDLQLCESELPYIIHFIEFDDGINEYLWLDGDNSPGIIITGEGTFGVNISNDCFFDEVDFTVEINPEIPSFFDFTDTITCADEPTLIFLGFTQVNYEWQDGSSLSFYEAPGPGIYSVTVSNFCGEEVFDFEIDEAVENELDLGEDISICPGDSVLISSPNGEDITWSNGQTSDQIWVSVEGPVVGMVEGFCEMISDTIEVIFNGMAPDVSIPDSILVCGGDTLTISASSNPSGVEFSWNSGEQTAIIEIYEGGLYIVNGMNNCATVKDSVFVTIGESLTDPNLQEDYTICEGDSISLSIIASGGNIEWSTGSIDSTITINNEGNYSVSIANSCKTKVDSFTVSYLPQLAPLELGPDIGICLGNTATITAAVYDGEYTWNNDAITNEIVIDTVGQYWLVIEGKCNTINDTIDIFDLGSPPIIDLGQDVSFCDGDSVTIDIGDAIVDEILWNNASTESSIVIESPGTYIVFAMNVCGSNSDTIIATINNDIPQIELGEDQSICPGDSILLDLGTVAGTINWNNGASGESIYATTAGFYIATLSSSCGESIDTILITELPAAPDVDLGEDVILCDGALLNLQVVSNSSTIILWNDGDDEKFKTFTETGTIWVELTNFCGKARDSIELFIIPSIDPVMLPADVTICDELEYTLESGITQDNVSIFWNTLESTNSINIGESGTYWVQASNFCFDETDTFRIEFLESPISFDLGENDTICFGESIFMDGYQGDEFSYLWQDDTNQPTLTASESGTYSLEISNSCGSVYDDLELVVLGNLTVDNMLLDSYILCEEETLSIDLSQIPFNNVLWNDGSTDFQRVLSEPGEYFIDLLSTCNDTLLSFVFEHKICDLPRIYFPNIFTPNEDGINDFFSIELSDLFESPSIKVSIFNRWGEKVYFSEELDFKWDGTFKGRTLNPAVFAYYIEIEAEIDGERRLITEVGDVTIVK